MRIAWLEFLQSEVEAVTTEDLRDPNTAVAEGDEILFGEPSMEIKTICTLADRRSETIARAQVDEEYCRDSTERARLHEVHESAQKEFGVLNNLLWLLIRQEFPDAYSDKAAGKDVYLRTGWKVALVKRPQNPLQMLGLRG